MSISKQKVFVCFATADCEKRRNELMQILDKAGMEVLQTSSGNFNSNQLINHAEEIIAQSDSAIFLLSDEFGSELIENQYLQAMKRIEQVGSFRAFFWQIPETNPDTMIPEQKEFIKKIRNNIRERMSYMLAPYTLQLVEDIRTIVTKVEKKHYQTHKASVFLVYNELDELEGEKIYEQINSRKPTCQLKVTHSGELDYGIFTVDQMSTSEALVVYYKMSSIWATSFVKQIWKLSGGATCRVPIFVFGENADQENKVRKMLIPNVTHKEVPEGEVIDEIINLPKSRTNNS